jgi:RNA polymerase sigma-70 factor, ECF subfamily
MRSHGVESMVRGASAGRGNVTQRGTAAEPDSEQLEALLARCATGDGSALESLYALAAPILLAVLMKMLRNRDLAEDVLQDVFVKVWQQAGQFDRIRGRPLAWLISIARYRAIDIQRSQRPVVELTDVHLDVEPALQVADTAGDATALGLGAALVRCLEQIAAPQRRCLALAYQQGLSHGEIARAVGEPLGTVKSWVRRSLLSLRRCLEP